MPGDLAIPASSDDFSSFSPERLFIDHTYLGLDDDVRHRIIRRCQAEGYNTHSSYDSKSGWVLYGIRYPDGTDSWKPERAFFFSPDTGLPTERRIEGIIVHRLRQHRRRPEKVQAQVPCSVGVADIVTTNAIYEVKLDLTRPRLFEALAQVLLYREAINPELVAVIVGREVAGTSEVIEMIERLGVQVHFEDPYRDPVQESAVGLVPGRICACCGGRIPLDYVPPQLATDAAIEALDGPTEEQDPD